MLKSKLPSPQVLIAPDFESPFVAKTDDPLVAIEAVFSQKK